MSIATLKPPPLRADRTELLPLHLDTDLVVTPEDNPAYSQAALADLLESVREHGQLVPGWICPSPDLPEPKRLCIEGNRRLVARMLGLTFWAFDLGRYVPEEERIALTFQHNHSRRVMSREEIAARAARYIEITRCTAADAARLLNISEATLSRAFGDRRIPMHLKARAEQLGLSTRALVAALPVELMAPAIEYAETAGPDGKKPTRNQVELFIRQLKKSGRSKTRKPKFVPLRINGRALMLEVNDRDSTISVAEDLKAVIKRLGMHADVQPDGWPFLFQ